MAITPKPEVTFTIVESPFAPFTKNDPERAAVESARNIAYLDACLADCFARGEVPFASHAIYTRKDHGFKVLDDTIPAERKKGMQAGFDIATALAEYARIVMKEDLLIPASFSKVKFIRAFYYDRSWTSGMADGMYDAGDRDQTIDKRTIEKVGPVGYWSRENDQYWALGPNGLYMWKKAEDDALVTPSTPYTLKTTPTPDAQTAKTLSGAILVNTQDEKDSLPPGCHIK